STAQVRRTVGSLRYRACVRVSPSRHQKVFAAQCFRSFSKLKLHSSRGLLYCCPLLKTRVLVYFRGILTKFHRKTPKKLFLCDSIHKSIL
uniref:Uncharacterized protein n=1 Tax=Anopheles quadriannulatus TaxID=34691 RepID=A0A182XT84_ANOQN